MNWFKKIDPKQVAMWFLIFASILFACGFALAEQVYGVMLGITSAFGWTAALEYYRMWRAATSR
jgi:high-affinity nickel permease